MRAWVDFLGRAPSRTPFGYALFRRRPPTADTTPSAAATTTTTTTGGAAIDRAAHAGLGHAVVVLR